ncbi:DUF6427 family protein [Lutibacter sp.]|uniref:DUF6427 family protein n=1 Tax=Lutibacter sp. TaxID=1925666 RepID=UPI003566F480
MIANFFSKTKLVTVFSIVVALFIYYFIATFLLHSGELSLQFLVKRLGFFIWLVLFLLFASFIVKKNKLTKDNSYALILMVFLLGTFTEAMFSNPIVFANIVLMLGFRKIYSLRTGFDTKLKLFDACFWIGIATLIYSWSIFYLLLVYVSMIIHQKLTVKNLFIPVVGFAMPMLIYFTYCLYFENAAFYYDRFNYEMNFDFSSYTSLLKLLIPVLFLFVVLVWSLIRVTPKVVSVRNNFKFSWDVLINHLLISIVIALLAPTKNGSELFFIIFPSGVIISNLMQLTKSKIFKNLILYAFLLISIGVYLDNL